MKLLGVLFVLLMSLDSFAFFDKVPNNAVAFEAIEGTLKSVTHKCIADTCANNNNDQYIQTQVTVGFELKGCLDSLAPTSYNVDEHENGVVDIYVNAVNVANSDSDNVNCSIPATTSINIYLYGKYFENDIQLHFIN